MCISRDIKLVKDVEDVAVRGVALGGKISSLLAA
jgi:esterase/lipase